MAGEDAGLIVLDRSREELVSIAADAMLFLAVLLLAYGAFQLSAIAATEAERLQMEQQTVAAAEVDTDVLVRCDWALEPAEIRVGVGNAGERAVFLDRVVVAARDTGGSGYVDGVNVTTPLVVASGEQETVFLDRDRFDGELVQGVTLELVADTGPFSERSRSRTTARCREAADTFLRAP